MSYRYLNLALLVVGIAMATSRCISQSGYSAPRVQEAGIVSPGFPEKGQSINWNAALGAQVSGKTFYQIAEGYTCMKNGVEIRSWKNAIRFLDNAHAENLGDLCYPKNEAITDPTTLQAFSNGTILTDGKGLYDYVESIEKAKDFTPSRFTEAYCILDQSRLASANGKATGELHFQVIKDAQNSRNIFRITNDGQEENQYSPIISKRSSDKVLLYQFNDGYSAYVSLQGSGLLHSSLFTTYDSKHLGTSAQGICYLNQGSVTVARAEASILTE